MIDWWPADNSTRDIAGSHNGTLVNGATYGGGKVDQAFSLDGVDDYVDVGDADLPVTFTIDAWINPTDLSSSPEVVDKDDGDTSRSYSLEIDSTGQLDGAVFSGAAITEYRTNSPVITTGSWQHIVMTYDGNAGPNQKIQFYVDGVLQPSSPNGERDNGGAPNDTSFSTTIGTQLCSGAPCFVFKGEIDEVELFGRVLTPEEIATIFSAGSSGKCKPVCTAPPAAMVSWWPGDGNAHDVQDGNDGTLEGSVAFPSARVNEGFHLNGTDQDVFIGNPANLQLQDFTIDTWIRRDSASVVSNNPAGQFQLAAIFSYGTNGYGFGLQPDGTLLLTKVGVSGTNSTGQKVSDTSFHHVVVTKSGSTVTFYVDGVAAAADASYDPGFEFTSNAYLGFFGSGGG